MSEGMLPTPVKTPRKKTIPKLNAAARALFQDIATEPDEIVSNSKRSRKTKRYNGFSLESFSSNDQNNQGRIQIFTDSRDTVPQVDTSETNPFLNIESNPESSSKNVLRTSKRRKISGERKTDPQVQEALEQDDGMVYVFRGKKVYRRFDDEGDEEEEIEDAEDLGLLQHTPAGTQIAKPLRTLTRKSIRPTRLFQKELKQRSSQNVAEEEALTDVEEFQDVKHNDEKKTEATEVPFDLEVTESRRLRSSDKLEHPVEEPTKNSATRAGSAKKASPFDSWRRVKAGGAPTSARGKKRAAPDSPEEDVGQVMSATPKKTRI